MSPTPPPSRRSRTRRAAPLVLLGLFVALPPLLLTRPELEDYSQAFVLVLAVLGVSILTGTTGLISLGHAVFVAIGAFSVANLLDAGLPVVLALPVAALFAGLAGIVLALPALRVRGPYLALITLGLTIMFPPIARRLGTLTGSALGRTVRTAPFDPPDFLHLGARLHMWNYLVCLVVVGLWFIGARNLLNSRMGRAVKATKDHEYAAAAFGINIATAKTGIFGISAAMAGTAGALQALIDPYLNANDFDWNMSLELYSSAVIGGLGSLLGAILGVVTLTAVPWLNDTAGLLDNASLAFGIGLLIVILVAPNGLAGEIQRLRTRLTAGRTKAPSDADQPDPNNLVKRGTTSSEA